MSFTKNCYWPTRGRYQTGTKNLKILPIMNEWLQIKIQFNCKLELSSISRGHQQLAIKPILFWIHDLYELWICFHYQRSKPSQSFLVQVLLRIHESLSFSYTCGIIHPLSMLLQGLKALGAWSSVKWYVNRRTDLGLQSDVPSGTHCTSESSGSLFSWIKISQLSHFQYL